MRINSLELIRYGIFEKKILDFSKGSHGLHIVLGNNEAGKSTCLRGLNALLYGIRKNNSDDFLWEKEVRLGGILQRKDGQSLSFERKKGNKQTILDRAGKPLAEDVLAPFLGLSVQAQFEALFGIDHAELSQNSSDLLKSDGEIGKMLMATALGGISIQSLMEKLNLDCEELFKQKGQKQQINEALNKIEDLNDEISQLSEAFSSRRWAGIQDEISGVSQEISRINQNFVRYESLIKTLTTIKNLLPRETEARHLQKQLDQLGEVVRLDSGFHLQYSDAVKSIETARSRMTEIEARIEEKQSQRGLLRDPGEMLSNSVAIEALHTRGKNAEQTIKDTKELKIQQQKLEAGIKNGLEQLPGNWDFMGIQQNPLTAVQTGQIQKLIQEHHGLAVQIRQFEKDIEEARNEVQTVSGQLSQAASRIDTGGLEASMAVILQQGDLEGGLSKLQERMRAKKQTILSSAAKLPFMPLDVYELESVPFPLSETILKFESEFQSIDLIEKGLNEKLAKNQSDIRSVSLSLEKSRQIGHVPTESELYEARAKREETWSRVVGDWLGKEEGGQPLSPMEGKVLAGEYAGLVREADQISDRLRNEANRVAENAGWLSELSKLEKEKTENDAALKRIQEQRHELSQRWGEAWKASGIATPLLPTEMKGWMGKITPLQQVLRELHEHEAEEKHLVGRIQEACANLDRQAKSVGLESCLSLRSLNERLECLTKAIQKSKALEEQKKNLATHIAIKQSLLEQRKKELGHTQAKLSEWQKLWIEALKPLRMDGTCAPDEVARVLKLRQDLEKQFLQHNGLVVRIQEMDDFHRSFTNDFRKFVRENQIFGLPDDPIEGAKELYSKSIQAKMDQQTRDSLDAQIQSLQTDLAKVKMSLTEHAKRLESLLEIAGCQTDDEVRRAIENNENARHLEGALREQKTAIEAISGGSSILELKEEALRSDLMENIFLSPPDHLGKRREYSFQELEIILGEEINRLTRERDRIAEERDSQNEQLGRKKSVLSLFGAGAHVAEKAAEKQEMLADLQAKAEKYITLKMAHGILKANMERLQREYQGPLLQRAGEIFNMLTLGSFEYLDIDQKSSKESSLVGVKDGMRLGVGAMSAGTVDQLYLSFRLAYLDSILENTEPMPFIVDDILVNFDNRRAAATIKALAEFSTKTQVIFFTHHEHLLGIAEEALPQDVCYVHKLN